MMATYILPTTINQPPPQVRREARVTLIEDELQVNLPSYYYPSKLVITSPMSDDVPKPRGLAAIITPGTDATSVVSSMWSHRSANSSFDSLYDLTDSEGEEVPLKLSASVKKHVIDKERSRYPSLVIPSPSQWPSIHKPQPSYAIGLSPASKLTSPSAFSVWQARRFRVPSGTSTPSLDGSLTSEELALSSCPSTPDLSSREEIVNGWEPPCQLHPDAFETLHQLSPEDAENEIVERVIEVPEEAAHEMKEIIKSTPVRLDFALISVDPDEQQYQDPVSALSVPSPGGFFSSLAPVAAQTWAIRTPEPSTSVAENFYGVPWRAAYSSEQRTAIVTALSPTDRGPSTAIKDVFSPIDREVEIAEITDVCQPPSEYNEEYREKLKQSALAHFERTKGWLDDQFTMLHKIVAKEIVPSTPEMASSPVVVTVSADNSPSKKSVRFAPEASSPRPSTSTGFSALSSALASVTSPADGINALTATDTILLDGFNSTMERTQPNDVFVHRQTRLESTHTQRRNFSAAYCRVLADEYQISEPTRPISNRPISTMLPAPSPEDDEKRETIAVVERECQALEQVTLAAWELEALSYIRKGLLNKEVETHIKSISPAQILDFGGKPNCDWGWKIATDHPDAKVCTAYLGARDILTGPVNHTALEIEKPFALAFADNTFDLISARTLHSLLKADEIALTLKELHRVLKPTGYLDFCLLDALLINVAAGSWGQVMNAEFGHKLQQRGYEREPTKHFQSRLSYAGFHSVKRMWMFLGMSDVCPIWYDAGKIAPTRAPTRPLPSLPSGGLAKRAPPRGTEPAPKPTGTVHYKVQIKDAEGNALLDPDGNPAYYPPAFTGSTEDIAPITALWGARMWEQWVYKLAREMGGLEAEKQMLEQVCGVLEQGGKMGSGFGCLMGVARK